MTESFKVTLKVKITGPEPRGKSPRLNWTWLRSVTVGVTAPLMTWILPRYLS